jgi:hypothetical protein
VDNAEFGLADVLSVLEGEAEDALGCGLGDEFDGLDDAVDHDVLDSTVFSLGVLTDQDSVDVVVGGLVTGNALAGTDVGEKVEGSAEGKVERDVTLADGCSKRTFEGDIVAVDAVDGLIGDDGLAILQGRSDIDGLPFDRNVCGGEDVLDGL